MSFDLGSDLHLEIGGIKMLTNPETNWIPMSPTLVLAGDIVTVKLLRAKSPSAKDVQAFFRTVSKMYKQVIWVFGNHEYYGGNLTHNVRNARDYLQKMCLENVFVLERSTLETADEIFFGTTLWTDFNKGNPVDMQRIEAGLNDYATIKLSDPFEDYGERLIRADDILLEHQKSRAALKKFIDLKTDKTKVLVTHHAPSMLSVRSEYKGHSLNCGYASELFNELYDSDIKVCVHGHMHDPVSYMIGDNCRVLSNPRGYFGFENRTWFWKPMRVPT